MAAAKNRRNLRTGEPRRQCSTGFQVVSPQLCTRYCPRFLTRTGLASLFIAVARRHVDHLLKRDRAYTDFACQGLNEALCLVGIIEGPPAAIDAGAGMIPTHDKKVCAII